MMRDDEHPSDAIDDGKTVAPGRRVTSLPPAAKTIQVAMNGLRDLLIPAMCLASMKMGFEQGGWLFGISVIFILGGNMGLRKAEGSVDVGELISMLKR
jgi:hypothetical protein